MNQDHFGLLVGFLVAAFNVFWLVRQRNSLASRYLGASVPSRFVVGVITTLVGTISLFAGSLLQASSGLIEAPAFGSGLPASGVALITLGWLAALIDYRTQKLPTDISVLMFIEVVFCWLLVFAFNDLDFSAALAPLLGVLVWVVPIVLGKALGGVGGGDLKLVPAIGFALGTSSVYLALVGIICAFISASIQGAVVGLGRRGLRARFAMGPHLIFGSWLVWILNAIGRYLFV